ncbi:MAG TPA: hypothetical protein PK771_08320 [Spirochaetota bacterium]|nr:hypothetical protein [Spirochaetota bacterium]
MFLNLFNSKEKIHDKILVISSELETSSDKCSLLFKRGVLYLKIEEPEKALCDFIIACKQEKSLIKKCRFLCGKYHPLLLEKFMSATYYTIDTDVIKPFTK